MFFDREAVSGARWSAMRPGGVIGLSLLLSWLLLLIFFSFIRDLVCRIRALCSTIFLFASCASPHYSFVRIISRHVATAFCMTHMYACMAFNQVPTLVTCHTVVPSFPSPSLVLQFCFFCYPLFSYGYFSFPVPCDRFQR